MSQTLDPAYRAAADRRQRQGRPRATSTRSPVLIVIFTLVGFGLAVAGMALRVPLGAAQKQHDQLVGTIHSRQQRIDSDTTSINALQQQITRFQNRALQRSNHTGLSRQLAQLSVLTGAVAVTGPGLELSVDDAKASGTDAQGNPRTDNSGEGRVTSSDLQVLVNGLWQAGAEAIAINGQRLTSETAIRFAGQAILVNFRPIVPPYVITAVGAGDTMKQHFTDNSGGSYLEGLVRGFGIRSTLTTRAAVQVPAGPAPSLTYAHAPKETR